MSNTKTLLDKLTYITCLTKEYKDVLSNLSVITDRNISSISYLGGEGIYIMPKDVNNINTLILDYYNKKKESIEKELNEVIK